MRLVVFVQVLILITGISANAADRRVPPPHKPQPPATTAPSEPPTSGAGKFGGQTRGAGDDKTPAAGERGTEQSPFIVKVLPFPSTDWVAVFTAVLCTVGVLQLAVFGLQARRLKQTIQAMRATEMTQLRAYVGVERMEVILEQSQPSISVAGFHDLIHIGLKNFGVTPAYQVSCKTTLQEMKGKGRLPKGFVFSEMQPTLPSEHELTISYDVIDKDQSKTYPILFSVEWKDFFMAANRGEIAIYVWGNIDFLDIYDRKWTRNFCYRYASEGAASARFTTHDEYNDERCLEDPTKRRPCWRRRPFGIP